jgi:hypothetical protein
MYGRSPRASLSYLLLRHGWRKAERERRAAVRIIGGPDLPTMGFKNRTENSQPHSHAGTACRKERFKEARKIGLPDAGPRVLYRHDNIAVRSTRDWTTKFAPAVDACHRLQATVSTCLSTRRGGLLNDANRAGNGESKHVVLISRSLDAPPQERLSRQNRARSGGKICQRLRRFPTGFPGRAFLKASRPVGFGASGYRTKQGTDA